MVYSHQKHEPLGSERLAAWAAAALLAASFSACAAPDDPTLVVDDGSEAVRLACPSYVMNTEGIVVVEPEAFHGKPARKQANGFWAWRVVRDASASGGYAVSPLRGEVPPFVDDGVVTDPRQDSGTARIRFEVQTEAGGPHRICVRLKSPHAGSEGFWRSKLDGSGWADYRSQSYGAWLWDCRTEAVPAARVHRLELAMGWTGVMVDKIVIGPEKMKDPVGHGPAMAGPCNGTSSSGEPKPDAEPDPQPGPDAEPDPQPQPDAAPDPVERCGDGICSSAESCSSCASDCGACSGGMSCAPAPAAPADGATTFSPFPSLSWTPGSCAASQVAWYEIQIARARDFTLLVRSDHSYIKLYVNAEGLAPGTYFWRTRAVSAAGARGGWGPARQLTVRGPAATIQVPAGASRTEIQTALDTARRQTPARVVLAPGNYPLAGCPTGGYCLALNGARDVQLDGRGATLIVQNPEASALALMATTDVTVSGLAVDYNPLPHSQARVVRVGGGTADVEVLDGMPDLLDPHITKAPNDSYRKWAALLDGGEPGTSSPRSGQYQNLNPQRVGGRTFRIASAGFANAARVGDVLHQQARINGISVFSAHNAVGLALSAVHIFASPGSPIPCSGTRGLVIVNSEVTVKPGRYASSNADAIHAHNVPLGPWVEGNLFWGVMDDVVNLRPDPIPVTARSAQGVTLAQGGGITAGERVGIFNPASGETAMRTVRSVSGDGKSLTLDGAPGSGTFLYASHQAAPQTVFRFNTFRGGNRYGLLLRVVDSVIEGNVFERQAGAAISLENHPWWRGGPEGLTSEDLLIVNNEVRRNLDAHGSFFAAIMKADHSVANGPKALLRVRFFANTFLDWQHHAINLNHGVQATIACNTIDASSGAPALPAGLNQAIRVNDSQGVLVENNQIADPRGGYTPVTIVASGGVEQRGNGASAQTGACLLASSRRGAP